MTMRFDKKWSIGDRGAEYEFKVKLSMKLRGVKISDAELEEETSLAVDLFADELRRDYPWVGQVGLTGRSGGWLLVEDKKGEATEDELSDIDDRVTQARKDFESAIVESFGYEENGGRQHSERKALAAGGLDSTFNRDVDQWFDKVADAAKTGRNTDSLRDLVGIAKLEPTPKHLDLFRLTIPSASRRDIPWAADLRMMVDSIKSGHYVPREFNAKQGAIKELFSLFKQAASYHANGGHRRNPQGFVRGDAMPGRAGAHEYGMARLWVSGPTAGVWGGTIKYRGKEHDLDARSYEGLLDDAKYWVDTQPSHPESGSFREPTAQYREDLANAISEAGYAGSDPIYVIRELTQLLRLHR